MIMFGCTQIDKGYCQHIAHCCNWKDVVLYNVLYNFTRASGPVHPDLGFPSHQISSIKLTDKFQVPWNMHMPWSVTGPVEPINATPQKDASPIGTGQPSTSNSL